MNDNLLMFLLIFQKSQFLCGYWNTYRLTRLTCAPHWLEPVFFSIKTGLLGAVPEGNRNIPKSIQFKQPAVHIYAVVGKVTVTPLQSYITTYFLE